MFDERRAPSPFGAADGAAGLPAGAGKIAVSEKEARGQRGSGSHRERDDDYLRVILRTSNWRVIVCKDVHQWVLQCRTRAASPDGARWEGRHYCRTREALLRLWRALSGDDGAALATLPERFEADR